MTIFTKTGDQGQTSLGSGERVSKADLKVEAYGTIDELSSVLGVVVSFLKEDDQVTQDLLWIQRRLFSLGTVLAFPNLEKQGSLSIIRNEDVQTLEEMITNLTKEVPELKEFILPGGTQAAAFSQLARTVCRRGERLIVRLDPKDYPLGKEMIPFLNRLSDYLFVLGRFINYRENQSEFLVKG